MDNLICIIHHFFELSLPTHHLGKVNVSGSLYCLLSRPLRGIEGLRLVLAARWLDMRLALGTSSSRHSDSRELAGLMMNITGKGLLRGPPSSTKLLKYDFTINENK